jgi:glycosyltransferase involved in cell wall biosynthesis
LKVAFIADGRSQHTVRWISYFATKYEVLLISPYSCEEIKNVKLIVLPGRFRLSAQLMKNDDQSTQSKNNILNRFFPILIKNGLVNQVWSQLKLIDLIPQALSARRILKKFNPTLVHALRVQNEGYIVALAWPGLFVISSWGSDFIDTAKNHIFHNLITRYTMRKTSWFISDCQRDLTLALKFNLPNNANKFLFPGNGGVDLSVFNLNLKTRRSRDILYCRGISKVTCVDILIQAFQKIKENPLNQDVKLVVLAPYSLHIEFKLLAHKYGVDNENINIFNYVDTFRLAEIMQSAKLFVSPLTSDGVPNSMLEAMACGMIPVMSDLESIREFITNGENGYLFDPTSVDSLTFALNEGLLETLREDYMNSNFKLIAEKSEFFTNMRKVEDLYGRMQQCT